MNKYVSKYLNKNSFYIADEIYLIHFLFPVLIVLACGATDVV